MNKIDLDEINEIIQLLESTLNRKAYFLDIRPSIDTKQSKPYQFSYNLFKYRKSGVYNEKN